MTKITEQQSMQRWDTLPDSLREALTSSANSDFVWKISEDEHIPNEKIYSIGQAVALVLMGFVHAEDMAQEIKDLLQIDIKIAQSIADAIDKRIFAPIRTDIDKVYQPASATSSVGPKMMNDIGIPKPPAFKPMPPVPPTSPKPTLSEAGWSRVAPSGPTLQFNASQIAPPPAPPKQAPIATPIAPKPAAGGTAMLGEFERLGMAQKNSPQTPAPSAPKPPITSAPAHDPAPVMLHEDSSFKAGQKSADFRLSRPDENAQMNMHPGQPAPLPVKPAVLELGNNPGQMPKPGSAPQRMVHYTELQNASSNMPVPTAGERHVTEITSPAPTPTMPPASQPPHPPSPPQTPGQEKMITKNYL